MRAGLDFGKLDFGSALLSAFLACTTGACVVLPDPWPSYASLAGSADTLRPSLALSISIRRGGGEPRDGKDALQAGVARERIARALRTTDLFRQVVLEPAEAEWTAHVLVRTTYEGEVTGVALGLEERSGALVFTGEERTEQAEWRGDDPVPDLLLELLRRAAAEGKFRGGQA